MNVICKYISGKYLSERALSSGYFIETEFTELEIGRKYFVYGMTIWGDAVHYLILDNRNEPHLYPAEIFSIYEHKIPSQWYFSHFQPTFKFDTLATWGYKEFALDVNHYNALIECKKEALEIFFQRKLEIEKDI